MYIITLAEINPLLESYQTNGTFYQKALSLVPEYRKEKVLKLRTEKDKCRSLTAGLLLNYSIGCFLHNKINNPPVQIISLQMAANLYNPQYDFATATGTEGKPYFKEQPEICFNLSHSGNYAVCIVADKPCGIDIEGDRTIKLNVAKRFFSSQEYEWILNAKDTAGQEERFLRIWTLKEAYAKLTGLGIAKEISQVEYILKPNTKQLVFAHADYDEQYQLIEQVYQSYRIAAIIQK